METRKEEDCKAYTFLIDNVADKDAFGSHQRLANVMAQAMVKNKELKVIGLLGPWGSGKSTVVGFLQQALLKKRARPSCSITTLGFIKTIHRGAHSWKASSTSSSKSA